MTDKIDTYYNGPGFASGNAASYDGAVKAAPVKLTQEAWILEKVTIAGRAGMTAINLWDVLPPEFGEVQLSTVRARLTTLRLAGKIVQLLERRPERYGVSNHAYVLPQYGSQPERTQGELWDGCFAVGG